MNFPWKREETELDREIAHHMHQLTAEYERQGYTRQEALRLAKREFGGSEQTKERCRDERRWAWLNGFRQDVVFGWRMLRRTPVVTTAAVLSLALAIGANTAIVSLMDLVLVARFAAPEPAATRKCELARSWLSQGNRGRRLRQHVSRWRLRSRRFLLLFEFSSFPAKPGGQSFARGVCRGGRFQRRFCR